MLVGVPGLLPEESHEDFGLFGVLEEVRDSPGSVSHAGNRCAFHITGEFHIRKPSAAAGGFSRLWWIRQPNVNFLEPSTERRVASDPGSTQG